MSGESLEELSRRALAAARILRGARSAAKDEALGSAADLLMGRREVVLEANEADMAAGDAAGLPPAALDRLRLDERRLAQMAEAIDAVRRLPDPVGEVVEGGLRPNGLLVERVRVPLGVVGVIYENRPNVTSDAAALCLKAGNVAFLRGSSSAARSNRAVAGLLREAAGKAGLPEDAVLLVEDGSRQTAERFVQLKGVIDCLVPRGGPGLVEMVESRASVPYVIDGAGNCHVYVHAAADWEMARRIVLNAKTSRPGVCNAAESLLVDAAVADGLLPELASDLVSAGVELVGDGRARALFPAMGEASEADFAREFLSLKLSVAVVDGLASAVEHIERYSSGHSEAIVTNDLEVARRFVSQVDAAAVLVNASTRFVDGGELGLGSELGISTQKLHARGPMGLKELTCIKYVVYGEGQVRT